MSEQHATLYRMVLPDHVCPYGVEAKRLLDEHGFSIDDRVLSSREAVDQVKEELGVSTTPQIFIDGERIGGASELAHYLDERSARP